MNALTQRLISLACGAAAPFVRAADAAAGPAARLARLISAHARVRGHVPATTQFDGPVHWVGRPRVRLGGQCRLGRNAHFETGGDGRISVGSHVRMSAGVHVVSHHEVSIGDDCLIGEYVSIRDANHTTTGDGPYRSQGHDSKPIRIGRNVWIGRGCVVLGGVSIGDDAVIGANSVVTRDVPAGSLSVGAPARAIRSVRSRQDVSVLPSRPATDDARPESAEAAST